MASNPTPRPWWWLAELTGLTDTTPARGGDLLDCPWCGGPAERVPWHRSSSVRTPGDPDSSAAAGITFARATCLFGHWFLVTGEPPARHAVAQLGAARRGERPCAR